MHKEVRLEHKRSKLAQESLDRRAARLNEMRIQKKHRLAIESQENRSARLQNMSILQKERLAKETQEEKAARLKHRSTLQEEKIANETVHKRAARLKHKNNLQEKKLAKETSDERAVRLKRQCAYKENSLANETPEQTSARLQNMSVYKQQFAQDAVLKVFNAEHLHNNETAPLIHQAILKDKVVKEKMDKFHHEMSSIESTICIVCSEKFPGTKMASLSTTCIRDKANPKLYSSENNMNPGAVPNELQVCDINLNFVLYYRTNLLKSL